MSVPQGLEDVAGAAQLHDWFGFWPSFHDAEIVSLVLNRTGVSLLQIHTWHLTNELDEKGYFKCVKDVVVEFKMENIQLLKLEDFNFQNVIFGLELEKRGDDFRLTLDPCFGLSGVLEMKSVSISLSAAPPSDRRGPPWQS